MHEGGEHFVFESGPLAQPVACEGTSQTDEGRVGHRVLPAFGLHGDGVDT
jgi:hypothetical protein